MIKISHRGNINGRITEKENHPNFIDDAISFGFDVEIDVRWNSGLYLGHDFAQYKISLNWLYERRGKLWVHAKDIWSMQDVIDSPIRCFFHEKERHVMISNCNYIWSHDLSEATSKSIIPLLSKEDINLFSIYPYVAGICTDYPSDIIK